VGTFRNSLLRTDLHSDQAFWYYTHRSTPIVSYCRSSYSSPDLFTCLPPRRPSCRLYRSGAVFSQHFAYRVESDGCSSSWSDNVANSAPVFCSYQGVRLTTIAVGVCRGVSDGTFMASISVRSERRAHSFYGYRVLLAQ